MTAAINIKTSNAGDLAESGWRVETNYPREPKWRVCKPLFPGSSALVSMFETNNEEHARLVAASFEMLAALKHAAANMPHPDQMIDDAIAKAEGRAAA